MLQLNGLPSELLEAFHRAIYVNKESGEHIRPINNAAAVGTVGIALEIRGPVVSILE